MAGRPLRPATRRSLGEPLPHQQADRTRPHPTPIESFPQSHAIMWNIRHYHPFPGAIPEHGAGRSRITHPFATLTTKQSPMDPVRLACVKHAASVHPEPESNPPQKTFMKSIRIDDSQNKKSTSTSLRKDALKKPHPSSNPPGYPTTTTGNQARNELAIIDYKEVVQTRS